MNEEMLFAREDQVIDLSKGTDDTVDFQKFLIFIADDLKLGVVAESVVEILTNQTITYLPRVPEFIRGIINMRGQIIPILDVRLRLGKPSREDSLVVVLNLDGTQLGILVDAVDQMIDIQLPWLLLCGGGTPFLRPLLPHIRRAELPDCLRKGGGVLRLCQRLEKGQEAPDLLRLQTAVPPADNTGDAVMAQAVFQQTQLAVGAAEHGDVGKRPGLPVPAHVLGLQHVHAAGHADDFLGNKHRLAEVVRSADQPYRRAGGSPSEA